MLFVTQKLDGGKAVNLKVINLTGRASWTDYLVIASGTSSRHVLAMAHNLQEELKKMGYRPRLEGLNTAGNWVVLDMESIIVHLFNPESRLYYALEEIWQGK